MYRRSKLKGLRGSPGGQTDARGIAYGPRVAQLVQGLTVEKAEASYLPGESKCPTQPLAGGRAS